MNDAAAPLRRRRRPPRRPRLSGQSFNKMLPNLMTLVGLCVGLSAIRMAMDGHYGGAVIAIAVSGIIDGLDGRLARLLRATSRFGAEFDSLADFLCFGVAPALVLYLWSLNEWGAIGFLPSLMFASAMALRLARFNAAIDKAHLIWLRAAAGFPGFVGAVLVGTALLCVSTLPVWSFKNFKIPTANVLPLLLGVVIFAAILLADPYAAGALLGLAYIAMLPFSRMSYQRLAREAETRRHADEAVEI